MVKMESNGAMAGHGFIEREEEEEEEILVESGNGENVLCGYYF